MGEVEKQQIIEALSAIQDPDLGRDIVSLGFVKDVRVCGGTAAVRIELTTPACPVRDQMREQARQAILAIPGIDEANVEMTAQVRASGPSQQPMLPGVKNIVPVASGKGGVGKSTVSANLAAALAASGASIGLMDADIYGPSIPTLLGINTEPGAGPDGKIVPVQQYGMKVISMGFFLPSDRAVVWRGPMLDKMITQFLMGVQWGELDYLIIDLPPGTGDVQLSLCQKVPLTGAVIVSTPQDVALNVAQKAIFMFNQLNCPILGIVENMSYYICGNCGQREDIFGSAGGRKISQQLQIPFLGEIPLAKPVRVQSDSGRPLVLSDPESEAAKAFQEVAGNLAAQISIRSMAGDLNQDIKISF